MKSKNIFGLCIALMLVVIVSDIGYASAEPTYKFDNSIISCDFDSYEILEKAYIYCDVQNKKNANVNEDLKLIFDKADGVVIEKIWAWKEYQEDVMVFKKTCDHSEFFESNQTWNNFTYSCEPVIEQRAAEGWVEIPLKQALNKEIITGQSSFKLSSQKIDAYDTNKYKIKIRVPFNSEGKFDVFFGDDYLDPWWNANWEYKMKIEINQTGSGETDVPVLVNGTFGIDTASLIAAGKMNTTCKDIRFVNSTEDGELDFGYDFESGAWGCNKANTLIWIDIPSVGSGNTTAYMYYGNPAATAANSDADTWDNDFIAVYHFGEESGNTSLDLTGRGHHLVNYGGGAFADINATGVFGSALEFNQSGGKYYNDSDNQLDATSQTFEMWLKPLEFSGDHWVIGRYASSQRQWELLAKSNASMVFSGLGNTTGGDCNFGSFSVGQWYYIVLVMNSTHKLAYVDGSLSRDCTALGWNGLAASDSPLTLASLTNGAWPDNIDNYHAANWNGTIDELRISNVTRSDDWIKRQYEYGLSYLQAEQGAAFIYVDLESPADTSFSNTSGIAYTFTPNLSSAIQGCSLWMNLSGSWQNVKNNDTEMVNATSNNINYDIFDDGNYTWNIYCSNTSTGAFATNNWTINIQVPPTMSYQNMTPVTAYTYNDLYVNATCNDGNYRPKRVLALDEVTDAANFSSPVTIKTKDDVVYVAATGDSRITLMNATNKSDLTFISTIKNTTYLGNPADMDIETQNGEDFIYVSAYNSGAFTVVNVTDKTSPFIIYSSTNNTGTTQGLDCVVGLPDGDFCASGSDNGDGVALWNVTNPAAPVQLDYYTNSSDINGVGNVKFSNDGNYLYVAVRANDGVSVLNITNRTITPSGNVFSSTYLDVTDTICVDGDMVYAASTGNDYISAVNVSDKANPTRVSSLAMSEFPMIGYTNCTDDYLYIRSNTNTLSVINKTDPSNMNWVHNLTGTYIYLAYDYNGYGYWTDHTSDTIGSVWITGMTAYYTTFRNDTVNVQGSTTVENGTNTLIKTIDSSLTSVGDEWISEVWCGDGTANTTHVNTTTRTIQETPVYVYLESPGDDSWSTTSNIAYTFTPNLSSAIQNCTLYANESGSWQAVKNNDTEMVNATSNNINYDLVTDANYTWNVQCCMDTACTFADANYTVFIDTVDPTLTIQDPTNTTTLAASTTNVGINITTPNEISWCQYKTSAFNWGAGTNFTTGQGTLTHNETYAVSEGTNYTLYYNCKDTAGNNWDGANKVHEFYVTAIPAIDYVSPASNATTYALGEDIIINVSIDVDISDLDTCFVDYNATESDNLTSNTSGSRPNYYCTNNLTGSADVGWSSFRVFGNNTAGDLNNTAWRYIYLYNTYRPSVSIGYPSNGTTIENNSITINWTGTDADNVTLTYYYTIKPDGGVWESWNTTSDTNVTITGLNESRWDFMIFAFDGIVNSTNQSAYFTYAQPSAVITPTIRTEYYEPPLGESFRADFSCQASLGNDSDIGYMEYGIILNSTGYRYILGNVSDTSNSDYCDDPYEICDPISYGYISEWAMINPLSNSTTTAPYGDQDWNESLTLYISCANSNGFLYNDTKIVNMSGQATCDAAEAWRTKECFENMWGLPLNEHGWSYGIVSYPFYGRFYADTEDYGTTPSVYYSYTNVSQYGNTLSSYDYQCKQVFTDPVQSGAVVWDQINYFQYPGIVSIGDSEGNNMISLIWIDGRIYSESYEGYWQPVGYYTVGEQYTYVINFDYISDAITYDFAAYEWHDGLREITFEENDIDLRTLNPPVIGNRWFCLGLTSSLCNTDSNCLQSYMKYPNGTYYGNDTQSDSFYVGDNWGDIYMNTTAWTYGWAQCVNGTLDDESLINRTQWTRTIWDQFNETYGGAGWRVDNATYTTGVCRNTIMIDNLAGGSNFIPVTNITPNQTSDTQQTQTFIPWLEALGWKIPTKNDYSEGSYDENDYFGWDDCDEYGGKGPLCVLGKGLSGGLQLIQDFVFGNFLPFLIIISILMGIGAVYGIFQQKKGG